MIFEKATEKDLCAVTQLYDDVCDSLEKGENLTGWGKGGYPTEKQAKAAIQENTLYVLRDEFRIAATVILKHKPIDDLVFPAWDGDYSNIYTIHIFAVHPDYWGKGVGDIMLRETEKMAKNEKCICLRLDAVKGNLPAINLYKRNGFEYVSTVSLGYERYGLPWFELYEKRLF